MIAPRGVRMGGPNSGQRRDPVRERRAAQLRARGLTYQEVGRRVGLTTEGARQLPAPREPPPVRPLACTGCGGAIASPAAIPADGPTALCLPCLSRRPDAPIGVRLKACRLAAGLSK